MNGFLTKPRQARLKSGSDAVFSFQRNSHVSTYLPALVASQQFAPAADAVIQWTFDRSYRRGATELGSV